MYTPQEAEIDVAKLAAAEIYGRECAGCMSDLEWKFYRRDSSSRDGYAALCTNCEATPKLSTQEYLVKCKERNYYSEGVKRQRWLDQEDLKDDDARVGRPMRHDDFLAILRRLVPNLYATEGRIVGCLALFRIYPGPQTELNGMSFKYLGYMDTGMLPEFSQYDFNQVLDIPLREKRRGWRSALLSLIKNKMVTEEIVNQVFGVAAGTASNRYRRILWEWRNQDVA